jgi:phosphatidylglycerophosphatase A
MAMVRQGCAHGGAQLKIGDAFVANTTMFTIIVVIENRRSTEYTLNAGEVPISFRKPLNGRLYRVYWCIYCLLQLLIGTRLNLGGRANLMPRTPLQAIAVVLATGLQTGRIPFAPGTFGSLLGIPTAWLLGHVPGLVSQAAVLTALCVVGVFIVNAALPALGGSKDPGCVVFDEIAGQSITFFLVPMTSVVVVVLGFLLFRLFDITKPPPARNLEKLPAGLGVMADDWAAGIYANLALHGILAFAPSVWFPI